MAVIKLDRQNVEDILGLTPMQEGMLFHYINQPESEQYFEQLALRLSGAVNEDHVLKAWVYVSQCNEMLRTVYRWADVERPMQIVLKQYNPQIMKYDFSSVGEERKEHVLTELKKKDRKEKLDLNSEPYRVLLCKLNPGEYEMIISNHHILYDGWSNGILLKEWLDAYHTLENGETPQVPGKTRYKEYIKWIQKREKSSQELYWREYLAGYNTGVTLPSDNLKKSLNGFSAEECIITISRDLYQKVTVFVREQQITLATLLYTAWGILLCKYGYADDVVFGTTVSGRPPELKGIEEMVGLFINTVPLRVKVAPDEHILEILKKTERDLRQREAYESTPLTEVKKYAGWDGKAELFDSIVVFENYPLEERLKCSDNSLHITSFSIFELTNYDLALAIIPFDGITLKLISREGLFRPETTHRLLEHYVNIIKAMVENPGSKPGNLNMLTAEERQAFVRGTVAAKGATQKRGSLKERFEDQVAKDPDNIALLSGEEELTYKELNQAANRLVGLLINGGVTAGDRVGICCKKADCWLPAMLGVVKAGACYVLIDHEVWLDGARPHYDDELAFVITDNDSSYGWLERDRVIDLRIALENAPEGQEDPERCYRPEEPVYIYYQMNTGEQLKSRKVYNQEVLNIIDWFTEEFSTNSSDRLLLNMPLQTDIAQHGIHTLLTVGGTLVCHGEDASDPESLTDVVERAGITLVNCTPGMFNPLLEANAGTLYRRIKKIRGVLLEGELAYGSRLSAWLNSVNCNGEISYLYRAENGSVISGYRLPKRRGNKRFLMGRSIEDKRWVVLDKTAAPTPMGIPGELCAVISEPAVKGIESESGYLLNPCWAEGDFLYSTGILARGVTGGEVEFLGDMARLVKFRGRTVNLYEIEDFLGQLELFKDVAVVLMEDGKGKEHLCAYFTSDDELDTDGIIKYLQGELSEYMVPEYLIQLSQLPLDSLGRIDRNALTVREDILYVDNGNALPENEIEQQLLELWRMVLGVQAIGTKDNFFDIGGNSLLLIQLHAKIEKLYPNVVTGTDLFSYPTISKLAKFILEKMGGCAKKPLVYLTLPEGYFTGTGEQKSAALQIGVDPVTVGKLRRIAEVENIELYDVMLSMYLYLFNQVTGEQKITVHTTTAGSTAILGIGVDLSQVQGFSQLFRLVAEQRSKDAKTVGSDFKDIIRMSSAKGERDILPFFHDDLSGITEAMYELTAAFDLVLTMSSENGDIKFLCEYNAARLHKDKIKGLVNDYIGLVQMLAEKY